MPASLEDLPEELKLAIISFFDLEPTSNGISASKGTLHGSLGYEQSPLKQLSRVSRRWNSIIKPTLLSRLLIRISPPDKQQDNRTPSTKFRAALRDAPDDIEKFIALHDVPRNLQSLTLHIHDSFAQLGEALRNAAQHSTDIISMNKFWRRLFNHVDPMRLSIVAPVSILGWLSTVEVVTSDAWAFPQMEIQALELYQDRERCSEPSASLNPMWADAWDTEVLFRVRPWTDLRLIEGSMLQAYGGYEYFNKQPPTILRAVSTPRSPSLTSFTHNVIFPFNTHVDYPHLMSFSYYKHIHLQYAPGPDDKTLDEPKAVPNQIDLRDCWREIEQIYKRAVYPPSPLFRVPSCVESFSSGDCHIASIKSLLDEAFALHVHDGWKADGPGRWVRTDKRNLTENRHA
ncbi:hypothetical protein MBLNU457_g1118t1 [Dothideomycetes sp. NU457]